MNKKVVTILSVLIILVFIGYIIFDTAKPFESVKKEVQTQAVQAIADAWKITNEFKVNEG